MNRRKFLVTASAVVSQWSCTATPVVFEQEPTSITQERLAALRASAGVPALAAAVASSGNAHRIWATGERKRGSGVQVTTRDRWHLGSITKSMTATLVARLVESNTIKWDETVGGVLGQTSPKMQAIYREASFRHLLSHRASLPQDLPLGHWQGFSGDISRGFEERKRYVAEGLEIEPKGPLAAAFSYSNLGYVVAAAMLEAKLNRSWESLIAEQIFQPLGLASAGIGYEIRNSRTAIDDPVGHRSGMWRVIDALGTDSSVAAASPAGSIYMNLADLLTYLVAHRDKTEFLSPAGWDTLHTPPFGDGYAMGWGVREDGSLVHDGSIGSWYASVIIDPAGKTAAASTTNTYNAAAANVVHAALRDALISGFEKPT